MKMRYERVTLSGKICEAFDCERLAPYLHDLGELSSVVKVTDPRSPFDGKELAVEDRFLASRSE